MVSRTRLFRAMLRSAWRLNSTRWRRLRVAVSRAATRFTVDGTTPQALLVALAQGRPSGADADVPAAVRYDVKASCQWRENEVGLCRPDCRVTVKIAEALPEWSGGGSADLSARWDAYRAAVEAHVESHAALAIQQANDLGAAVAALGTTACGGLQSRIDAETLRLESDYKTRHGQYDRYCAATAGCLPSL